MARIDYGSTDLVTSGVGYFGGLVLTGGGGTITDSMVSASAAIAASKMTHEHVRAYGQPNTTATTERKVIHVCKGAGTLLSFKAASIVACIGAATISVQLRKNGTNILTGALVLDNANTAYVLEDNPGFTTTSLAAGDALELDATATAGGGTLGTGFYVIISTVEAY